MYHYTDFDALKGIVERKELWLSSSLQMNDPFDRQHASICVKRMIFDDTCDYFSELRKSLSKDKIDYIFRLSDTIPFYSVSFCENDNDYLWKEYAKNYSGVRVRFEKDVFEECVKALNEEYSNEFSMGFNLLSFRKIEYGNGRDYIKGVGDNVLEFCGGDNKWYNWLELLLHIVSGTIKCNRYCPEKEYRLLFKNTYSDQYLKVAPTIYAMFNELQKVGNQEIMKHLGLLELVAKPKEHYSLNFNDFLSAGCITEILIGKNSDKSIADVEKLLSNNRISSIKVSKQKDN